MGLQFFKMSSKTPVKILGYFIRTMFLTHTKKKPNKQKNPWPILLVKILGLLKGTKILGLHRIEILGLAPVKILGYFIRTMFFDAKKPMVYFACQNLGTFKENIDFGAYIVSKMSCKTPVKFLGYFMRTMFLTPKTPCPTFACQNLGTFKEYRDIGLTSFWNLRISTCQNLGVFHKSLVFWRQKPMANFCLSKSWAFSRVQRH